MSAWLEQPDLRRGGQEMTMQNLDGASAYYEEPYGIYGERSEQTIGGYRYLLEAGEERSTRGESLADLSESGQQNVVEHKDIGT
jgi:hypothetical protein